MPIPDWSKSDEKTVKLVAEEAQEYLKALLQIATSSDQRAATLAGVFISATTAIAGAFIAYVATKGLNGALAWSASASGIAFAAAAILCIRATMPTKFYLAGNPPKLWYEAVGKKMPMIEALGEEASQSQNYIENNVAVMARASKQLKWGAITGMIAPFLGVAAYLLASVCFHFT